MISILKIYDIYIYIILMTTLDFLKLHIFYVQTTHLFGSHIHINILLHSIHYNFEYVTSSGTVTKYSIVLKLIRYLHLIILSIINQC